MTSAERPPIRIEPNYPFKPTDVLGFVRRNLPEFARMYNEGLPAVNPACRTIVTIIAYNEFRNGQVKRALSDLDNQTVNPENYEVILLVNNPSTKIFPDEAKTKADNEQLLEYIAEQQQNGKLANVRVVKCIDGELPPRHNGINRGVANEIASLRFQDTEVQDQGVIVQVDADISVAPTFLADLMEEYDADPNLGSTYIGRMPYPVNYTSDDLYVGFAQEYLDNVYLSIMREDGNIKGSGPTFAFRTNLQRHPDFRFYMLMERVEDYLNFTSVSKFRILQHPRIYVADRVRPEGYESTKRDLYSKDLEPISSLAQMLRVFAESMCDKVVNTDNLVPSNEELVRVSVPQALKTFVDIVQTVNPARAKTFQNYILQEMQEAYTRLDPQKTNLENILMGATTFALARVILDIFPEG